MHAAKLPSAKALKLLHERKLLPAFPAILAKLDEVIARPSSRTEDVANLVAADVLLASRLMRAASAVRYGPKPAANLVEAVARLGFTEVRAVAVAIAFSRSFSQSANIPMTPFWQHAFASAVATKAITLWLNEHQPSMVCDGVTAFLMGLLHDLGMLMLDALEPEIYAQVIEAVESGEDQLLAERRLLGTTHALMSGALSHHWRFSDQMSMALAAHHYPIRLQPVGRSWADAILLGEAMAVSLGYTNGVYTQFSPSMQEIVEARKEALSCDDAIWQTLQQQVSTQLIDEGWLALADGV